MQKFPTTAAQLAIVSVLTACACCASAQQAYPTKPIRIIVPYATGGSTDILARLAGQKLNEAWGQPVVVDNRPGGTTTIGSQALVKSAPDGYTIMVMSVDHVIVPNLIATSFDAIKDFAPVATISSGGLVMVLNPSVPANNLQEFIALAKSRPGGLNYASPGNGGVQNLAGEFLSILTGIKMQHIPYKGGGPAVIDLLGGQVQMYLTPPVTVVSHIGTGKLRAIAISGEARASVLPQVPTFSEAGLPAFDVKTWFAVLAPGGAQKEVIGKLSTEIARILRMPDVRERIASLGMEPFISTPDQFAALLEAEMAKFARIIKTANIRLEH